MPLFLHLRKVIVAAMLTAILVLTSLARPAEVYACTPPVGGLPVKTVGDRVAAADMTIEGTIVALSGEVHLANQVARIRVRQYFKGEGPALVTVEGYGTTGLCKSPVSLGQHSLFYIDAAANGSLRAFYLTQFDATAPADSTTIAKAAAAAGREPSRPDQRTYAIGAGLAHDGGVEAQVSPGVVAASNAASTSTVALSAGAIVVVLYGMVTLRGVRKRGSNRR